MGGLYIIVIRVEHAMVLVSFTLAFLTHRPHYMIEVVKNKTLSKRVEIVGYHLSLHISPLSLLLRFCISCQ